MTMQFSPSVFHHPPVGVSCALLLLLAFPFISLAIIKQRPFLPVVFFYTPLLIGLGLSAYTLFVTLGRAPRDFTLWRFHMFAWGIAESITAIGFGAVSSFATALFNLRVRRRAMYPVFPITLGIAVASWLGARAVLDRL